MIIRKPTEKQKIEALDKHSGKKKYEWSGSHRGNGDGKNLWEALLDDSSRSSSQHWSIFENWAYDQAEYLSKDKEYRKEQEEINEKKYTDEKWWEYCHSVACDDDLDWIEEREKDEEVAKVFNIDFNIIEWECDNSEILNTDEVVAVCSCGYPLAEYDMWNTMSNCKEEIPECFYCGEDLRSKAEKVLDGI